eukprot:COSAG06_NODE_1899_length_8112_cov_7.981904_5_plen_58_part_00
MCVAHASVDAGMSLYSNVSAPVKVTRAEVWTMGSIWATQAEVLATRRSKPVAYAVGN